jgi:hypothetical protein
MFFSISELPLACCHRIGQKDEQQQTCTTHATSSYPIENVTRTRGPGCLTNILPEPSYPDGTP